MNRLPPSEPTVLGIDLGTSSVKAVVIDAEGHVLAQAGAGYPVSAPHPRWSETAPQDWLDATVTATRAAVTQLDSTPAAIGLSGQMHGLVAADATGKPVRPAMLWSDARAVRQLDLYRNLPAPVRARLANPLSPGMAGPMLAWLASCQPQAYAATKWAMQPKDWLRAQLTGRFASEPSDASATLLYDVTTESWDADVIDALGLDADRLPEILPSSSAHAGVLTPDAAQLLGLRAGIPVAAGAADTAAAALGSELLTPDSAQLTIGTGVQLIRPVDSVPAERPSQPVTHLYRTATDYGWYRMGAVLNGGLTLGWVGQVLGASWAELYATAAADPRADDPFFLPHLHGERTPYLDPGLHGAWTDLAPQHGRPQLLRAALEGVAFAIRQALEHVLPVAGEVDRLRLAGGGTAEPPWRQLLADVLGYDLAPVQVPAASALGAALLGARAGAIVEATALGTDPSAPRTAPAVAARPRPRYQRLYDERYLAFVEKVQALRSPDDGPTG